MEERKEESENGDGFIQGNIPLIINSYVDIFSSFDSRSLSEKALSVDFISEVKRAARDRSEEGLEVVISVPKERRNLGDEFKIKKRLREHFHKHFIEKEREMNKIKKEGFWWVVLGVVVLLGVLFGLVNLEGTTIGLMLPILEIPCWFLIWEGMGKILLDSRKIEPDFLFYKKMANASIIFKGY